MKDLVFATTNKGKVEEAHAILGVPVEIAELEIDEVQSMDMEYVSKKKTEAAYQILKKPVITDDVGVFIEAWNGFPGPFAKHILDSIQNEGILKLMEDEPNRNVTVKCAIGYHDGQEVHVFIAEVKGHLADKIKGSDGWGFDFVVIPEGYSQTFAEMGFKDKNKISHRALALEKLKEYLDSQEK